MHFCFRLPCTLVRKDLPHHICHEMDENVGLRPAIILVSAGLEDLRAVQSEVRHESGFRLCLRDEC